MAEPHAVDFEQAAVSPGDVAVDIGANPTAEDHTSVLSTGVGDDGLVIAFDPFPNDDLIEIVDTESNVVLVREAVSPDAIKLEETNRDMGAGGPTRNREYRGGVPLDAVAYADYVKVDVEGWEWHVLRSGERLINRCQPVLLIETHPHDGKQRRDDVPKAVFDYMVKRGYLVKSLQQDQWIKSPHELRQSPPGEHLVGVTDIDTVPCM